MNCGIISAARRRGAGGSSGPAPTFVGSAQLVTTTANPVLSLTALKNEAGATATLQQGDLVLVAYVVGSNTNFTFTPASGWTKECDLFGTDSLSCNLTVWTKVMGATPDTSVTLDAPGGANPASIVVHAFRGVNATYQDALPASATGSNTGQPNPPAVTSISTNALIYVAGGSEGTAGLTPPAFTNSDLASATNDFQCARRSGTNTGSIVGAGFVVPGSAGAFDPAQWGGNTTSASNSWAAFTMALRPA